MNKLTLHDFKEILTYRRPAGSKSEEEMIARFIDTVPGMQADVFGNRWLRIGDVAESKTMISCHTDTVHTMEGRQKVAWDGKAGMMWLGNKSRKNGKKNWKDRNCLGSDDGAGCYAALRMIQAGVPALYVFHRAEECGGIGSDRISNFKPGFVKGIERCIAIDRRDTKDIITHQMMGRCCSDTFALALASKLGMKHKPCSLGTFTDSANYTDLIGECTNISVGYQFEHTDKEWIDVSYLEELIERLCQIDFESLPTERHPGEVESYYGDDMHRYWEWKYGHVVSDDGPTDTKEFIVTDSNGNKMTYDDWSKRMSASSARVDRINDESDFNTTEAFSQEDWGLCITCGAELMESEQQQYEGFCRECWLYVR